MLLPLLLAALLQPPTLSCQTRVFPDQGTDFRTRLTIQPSVTGLTYPVVYGVPLNAVNVGLEFWSHRFAVGPPKGSIEIHQYHILPGGTDRTVAPDKSRLTVAANNKGPDDDGVWTSFALSTVLHAGEWIVVGIFNANSYPVYVDFAVTLRECVQ
jgi:hypothetical protein